MSYQTEINYNDYIISLEYGYNPEGCLFIESWQAYIGNNEIDIPCRVESDFIEKQLDKWLDEEYSKNSSNYESERLQYLGDLAYDRMVGK